MKNKIFIKVFTGIICTLLVLSTLTFGIVYAVLLNATPVPIDVETRYYNLPNVVGDYGIYISKTFFVENDLVIPQKVWLNNADKHNVNNYSNDSGCFILGRGEYLGYGFETEKVKIDENQSQLKLRGVCISVNMKSLENKRKYNGYTFGTTLEEFPSRNDEDIIETTFCYRVNLKSNYDTCKKCQFILNIQINHFKDVQSSAYAEDCDSLFYSLLDNVVYRNI